MSGSKTLVLSSAKRSTSARYAAKLIASFLLANVRSLLGRRSSSPNCVPAALLSYAAQASKMQVCTIARARATIGGPMRESRTPCNAAAFHRTTTLSLALVWPSTPSGQIRTARVSKHRKYMGSLDADVDGRGILAAIGILPPAIVDHRICANHLFSLPIKSTRRAGYRVPLAVTPIDSLSPAYLKKTPFLSRPRSEKMFTEVVPGSET